MPAKSSIPNVNCLWGEVVGLTLAKLGVLHAVIAPGSRSAPLVWGLTRQKEIEAVPILDERSAGFFALGLAQCTDMPVALVCTSGTAAANFFPAVIEASESGVPLLVLTADRPPELRDCWAGQAIDQVKLYGSYARWHHEVALPESRMEMLRYLRQTLAHAWERAMHPWPGPVHLNFPFREPLAPVAVNGFRAPKEAELKKLWSGWPEFSGESKEGGRFVRVVHEEPYYEKQRGIIVAGPSPSFREDFSYHARYQAKLDFQEIGWPILADALSPLRTVRPAPANLVAHYDAILRNPAAAKALKPEVVVQIGPLPTSKILRKWLAELEVPVVVLQEGTPNVDPLHRNTEHQRVRPFAELRQLIEDKVWTRPDRNYLEGWQRQESAATELMAKRLKALNWLFEGKAAWLMSRVLPKGTPVFVASGMPVRDCEYFWEAGGGQEFYFNRGANGIDGTLSTALGVAHASGRPSVLYTGDLALLHDQNGFLAAKELNKNASLTIVLINNDGSGIFEHLPMAKFDPPFERYFATPQGVDFEKLADLHGVEYVCPKTWAQLEKTLRALPKRGLRLVELRTDRKRDAAFRRQMFEEISQELSKR